VTFREQLACAVGWHDWTPWCELGKVKSLAGSGPMGVFIPEEEQGKWIYTGEIMQARTCMRCHIEKRRIVVVE
jgi:hypothetical protein